MATYGNNVTIKVSAPFSASGGGSGTIYTVPANSYVLFNAYLFITALNNGAFAHLLVDGKKALGRESMTNGAVFTESQQMVAGPGQVISLNSSNAGFDAQISGVVFQNTP
jgi:hypothetical protein